VWGQQVKGQTGETSRTTGTWPAGKKSTSKLPWWLFLGLEVNSPCCFQDKSDKDNSVVYLDKKKYSHFVFNIII